MNSHRKGISGVNDSIKKRLRNGLNVLYVGDSPFWCDIRCHGEFLKARVLNHIIEERTESVAQVRARLGVNEGSDNSRGSIISTKQNGIAIFILK